MHLDNYHYERAFEAFLQQQQIPYVSVNQSQRTIFAGLTIKSFDFIIYPDNGHKLLVDVKGRKLSCGSYQRGHWGDSWATMEDVDGLTQWQGIFGNEYRAVFIFAYWLFDTPADQLPGMIEGAYQYQGRHYIFTLAPLNDYQAEMQTRSTRWNTVFIPAAQFRRLLHPFDQYVSKIKI